LSIKEACDSLSAFLSPGGISFRPPWLQCIGIGDGVLVLYVLKRKRARKRLGTISEWKGYPIRIVKTGPMQML
jgi:hypothetical protein